MGSDTPVLLPFEPHYQQKQKQSSQLEVLQEADWAHTPYLQTPDLGQVTPL